MFLLALRCAASLRYRRHYMPYGEEDLLLLTIERKTRFRKQESSAEFWRA